MAQQARGQRRIAIGQLAVDVHRGACAPQAVGQRFVRAVRTPGQTARRLVPQRAQRPGGAARCERADLLLQPQYMLPDALALAAARGVGERVVDEARQRLHEQFIGRLGDQQQRKIVAQLGEFPVSGEQGRAQAQSIDRVQVLARPPAGQEKSNLCLSIRFHVFISLYCR